MSQGPYSRRPYGRGFAFIEFDNVGLLANKSQQPPAESPEDPQAPDSIDFLGPDVVAGLTAAVRQARDDVAYAIGLDEYIPEPPRDTLSSTPNEERLAFPDNGDEEYPR